MENEILFLGKAIELASENVKNGGGPFGAVIVKGNQIVATGVNAVTLNNDPTAHAEIQAIRKACEILQTFDLSGCNLYSSCEPCPMCFSAVYWAHIDKVYFASNQHDAENAGFDDSHIYREIKTDPQKRTIPFIETNHPYKNEPFRLWGISEGKTLY
jgi:guanine deaminase